MATHLRTNFNIQLLDAGDVLVNEDGSPAPGIICIRHGYVTQMDNGHYELTSYPFESNSMLRLQLSREDLEAMAALLRQDT